MEALKYCLYGSAATVLIGLLIYIFILKSRIKKYNNQIEELKTEVENKKVELITLEKNSNLKIIELETQINYLKQVKSTDTQEKIDKIEKSEDIKTDINDIINKYNEKNN